MGQTLIPLAEVPVIVLNSGDPTPDNRCLKSFRLWITLEASPSQISYFLSFCSHYYALSGKTFMTTSTSSTSLLAAGANRVLKKSNSVVLTLGKLTKAQVNLANLIRALSTLSAADAVAHEYIPFKTTESSDITDCDQCGGDINSRRGPHKCKICGLVVHDTCRQLVTIECATAGSLRLSYRFYQETLLPYGAYNNLLQVVRNLISQWKWKMNMSHSHLGTFPSSS